MNWKNNWPETKQHLQDWWQGHGLVVGTWFPPLTEGPRASAPWPTTHDVALAAMPSYRAILANALCARQWHRLDCLAVADCNFGPGSLATLLGSTPAYTGGTTWFCPCWEDVAEPELLPPLRLDEENVYYRLHMETLAATRAMAGDNYATGMPSFAEGLDTLASLRGTSALLFDLLERPDWVHARLDEIHTIRLEMFERSHRLTQTREDWTFNSSFRFGGPGKTDVLQCDMAALISPALFHEFALPHLRAHCQHLDNAMYHLDGIECIDKLDDLLAIEELNAIEWSPDPKSGGTAHPRWLPLYRRILEAGKSLQLINLQIQQVAPLLDKIGTQGVFLLVEISTIQDAEALTNIVARFR